MIIKYKIIGLLVIGILAVVIVLYFFGFIYGFRNYGEGGSWKPIKEYEFNASKTAIVQKIDYYVSSHKPLLWYADSNFEFSKSGWYTVFIKTSIDTIQYIYRFKGDSLSWMNENKSTILLYSMTDKNTDITPTTIKHTNNEQIKNGLNVFESVLISNLE